MIQVIGIGNYLMGDDGIALRVIDRIKEDLEKLNLGIRCIKAETDFNFALENINKNDFIFILDSTLLNKECGQITQIPLDKVDNYLSDSISIHNVSLLSLIKRLDVKVSGIALGIEVNNIEFYLGLSEKLEKKFKEICVEVYHIIKEKSLEYVKKGEGSA